MKKQTAIFLSVSALLAINTFAPQVFWHADKVTSRFPASAEDDAKAKVENDKNGIKEVAIVEDKEAKKDDAISCLKEKQPAALEEQIKKLVEDKESVLKELEELKKAKSEKEVVKADDKSEIVSIMSQLTSLMISQQQQQQMMMGQMFSMMQLSAQQPGLQQFGPNLNGYMNPYAFDMNSFHSYPFYAQSFGSGFGSNIGIAHTPQYNQPMMNSFRAPSALAQQDAGAFDRNYLDPKFKTQYPVPHDGFNFGLSTSSDFSRSQF